MRVNYLIRQSVKHIIGCFGLLICCVAVVHAQADTAKLNSIIYSKLTGDNVQINLVTDGLVGEPGSFSTNNPARIALDFFGLKKNLRENLIKIGVGQVDSVVAVETEDRTRVIINLFDTARYEVGKAENGYVITVFNTEFDDSVRVAPKPFAKPHDVVQKRNVEKIDFRRSELGGGKLTIDFSEESVTVDTREKDGEIIVDLLGVNLPNELEKRLDVIDFATPVQTIDAFQNSENVRMVLVPQGKYQHLSYQSGKRFTLMVDPIIETEEDRKKAEADESGYSGERLSINFQKIDVRSALAVIADFTGINFVTSDSVQGEITINLQDVPWDQALDVIMKTKGLAKRQNGNVIWIAPAQEIARVEEEALKAQATAAEFAPLSSEIIQINYAKAKDIAEVIKSVKVIKQGSTSSNASVGGNNSSSLNVTETDKNSLLTERGSVTVDERTNSLLVQDVASKIKQLRKVIAQLDKPVRQVMVETRIVEASDTFSRELGARLGFQRVTENARFPGANDSQGIGEFVGSGTTEGLQTIQNSQLEEDGVLEFDTSRGTPGGLAVDLGASGIDGNRAASYAFDVFRTGTGFAHLITLELSALEANGRGKIIASPRLVTANQKKAIIKQGEERLFTVPGADQGEVEEKEAVLLLEVTPQITPDDRVILDVKITQDAFIPASDGAVGALRKKEVITQVLADNGETIIIGGIYQEEISKGTTKVPILGDIPILGNLFKKKSSRESRVELLIFLTPKIISPKLNLG